MTMSVYDFLSKLDKYFPASGKEDLVNQKINDYADCILEYVNKHKQQFDYDKIFKQLLMTYKFKTFPPLSDIIDLMPYGAIIPKPDVSHSGKEGEVIKRTYRGLEYEFVVVPNCWDNVMTISELDRDIARRNARNADTGTESF
jgi:hypothetical protein